MAIVCNQTTFNSLQEYTLRSTSFVSVYNWIADAYVSDFFYKNHWENLPKRWQETFQLWSTEDLTFLIDRKKTTTRNVPPLSLIAFKSCTEAYSLDRNCVSDVESIFKQLFRKEGNANDSSKITEKREITENSSQRRRKSNDEELHAFFKKHVKPKKRHEIQNLSKVIHLLGEVTNCRSVIDVGSGLGHLSRLLSFRYGLKVISVEAASTHAPKASKFDREIEREVHKKKEKGENSELQYFQNGSSYLPRHVTRLIHPNTSLDEFMEVIKENQSQTTVQESEQRRAMRCETDELVRETVQHSCKKMKFDNKTMAKDSGNDKCSCDKEIEIKTKDSDKDFPIKSIDSDKEIEIERKDFDKEIKIKNEDCNKEIEIERKDFDKEIEIKSKDWDKEIEIERKDLDKEIEIKSKDCDKEIEIKSKDCDRKIHVSSSDSSNSQSENKLEEMETSCKACFKTKLNSDSGECGTVLRSDQMDRFILTGLHACGDLTATFLRFFVNCTEAKGLTSVGCCYMKLSDENSSVDEVKGVDEAKGYPMSNCLSESPNHQLSYAARELACHFADAYCQRLLDCPPHLRIHSYRAALEWLANQIRPTFQRSAVQIPAKKTNNLDFDSYVKIGLQKLGLPEADVTDSMIATATKMIGRWKDVVAFYTVRLSLAPVIETIILLDRMLFLYESGFESAIMPIFDSSLSPRNFVLLAWKR